MTATLDLWGEEVDLLLAFAEADYRDAPDGADTEERLEMEFYRLWLKELRPS